MRLRVLFVQYEGDVMPNALVVTDDYMEDEHGGLPDYWVEECETVRKAAGEHIAAREAFITVPDDLVRRLFEPPSVPMSHIKAAS